jgi:phosphatidylglycerophosphatase A
LGFGAGLVPKAPGTAGTLVAIPLAWLLALVLPTAYVALLAIPLFAVGVWACGVTGRALGDEDCGSMVWDEIVAFLPLAVLCLAKPLWLLGAFLLFRLFDIAKPFPIRQVERRVKGGFGVMIDDVLAAIYAFLAFTLALFVAALIAP